MWTPLSFHPVGRGWRTLASPCPSAADLGQCPNKELLGNSVYEPMTSHLWPRVWGQGPGTPARWTPSPGDQASCGLGTPRLPVPTSLGFPLPHLHVRELGGCWLGRGDPHSWTGALAGMDRPARWQLPLSLPRGAAMRLWVGTGVRGSSSCGGPSTGLWCGPGAMLCLV